jgi:hypothetical protein
MNESMYPGSKYTNSDNFVNGIDDSIWFYRMNFLGQHKKQKFGVDEKGSHVVCVLWQNGHSKRWGTMSASSCTNSGRALECPDPEFAKKATRLRRRVEKNDRKAPVRPQAASQAAAA